MSATPASTVLAHRQPRILACVLCQNRKIKCDRNMPCSNCVKVRMPRVCRCESWVNCPLPCPFIFSSVSHSWPQANVTCTPSTPAPPRKRRRPNQDLQERLARCEQLLKHYAGGSVPTSVSGPSVSASTPTSSIAYTDASGRSPSNNEPLEMHPAGKMIPQEGGARFFDSQMWTSFYDEVSYSSRPPNWSSSSYPP
jgi:hypothetical protein